MMLLQYYFRDDFSEFEDYFGSIKKTTRTYRKNEAVNGFGEMMDEMYYIISGTMSGAFLHESGNVKTSAFYGKGYLAPLYFPGENRILLSFSFTAVTDLTVYVLERKTFAKYINENSELNIAMYEAYIKLVTLQSLELSIQLFSSGQEKICNFIYIYLKNTEDHENRLPFNQYEIGDFVGLNRANVAKYLKILREKDIIETHRNYIIVKNIEKLKELCTKSVL
ncbi:Crp/Fnr family transcriptional regulator [Eubacteriaceae bacterium ES3]|nr:Crp/Fnr family transcriptional regulator [Eubacteriaceae bacterium ES3]